MKIAVVLGSTRPNRLGERVAKWVMHETAQYPQAQFILLDLKDYNLPFFNEAEGPRGNEDRHPAENVAKWLSDIQAADGYIFITPEYNEGPSAVLKNAIDFLGFEANRKPAVIIGYTDGANGGMYAPIHLRVYLGEVGMVALKAQLIVLNADKKINEEGTVDDAHKESMQRRLRRLLDELFWFADALKVAREKTA